MGFLTFSLYMATLWKCLVPFDSLFQSVYSYSLSMILFLSVIINTFIFVFCFKSLLMRTQVDPHPCCVSVLVICHQIILLAIGLRWFIWSFLSYSYDDDDNS